MDALCQKYMFTSDTFQAVLPSEREPIPGTLRSFALKLADRVEL